MAKDGSDQLEGNDDRVGYGRPPKQHQVKPKEIRNPWGRKGKPRPKRDFLDEPFDLVMSGETITVTRRLALDHALFSVAMTKGRVSSIKELERRSLERTRAAEENATDETLSADESAAFERYFHRRLKELQANKDETTQNSDVTAQKFAPAGNK